MTKNRIVNKNILIILFFINKRQANSLAKDFGSSVLVGAVYARKQDSGKLIGGWQGMAGAWNSYASA
jgi:hypothetical protein